MKLILCGKGGCGKSTVSALLARAWAARGYQVLVIDADESNFGLHKQLGLDLPEDFTHYFGHKKGIMEDGAQDVFRDGWHLEDIPANYFSSDGAVRLMAIGKIADAGEGCACAMGVLTKVFLEHLLLRENEVVIIDTEAGVEHFGRGVDRFADAILMIADPSFESVQLAGKISEMGKTFEKPVFVVLNKADAQQQKLMEDAMENRDAVIGALQPDPEILMAGLKGEKLMKSLPEIETIIDTLQQRI
jgi:CO dehydrogenase maturation factor